MSDEPPPEDFEAQIDFEKAASSPNNATLWSLLADQTMVNREIYGLLLELARNIEDLQKLKALDERIEQNYARIEGLIKKAEPNG